MSKEYIYENWLSFNAETTKELFCPLCGKKVYPLAQNEEFCEHLFAICKEDSILYASEAFYEIIAGVYGLPKAILLDCVNRGSKFSEVAKKEDLYADLSRTELNTWANILNGINWISQDKGIPSCMISLWEESQGNDGAEWHWDVFLMFAAKEIGSKYLKHHCE